MGKGKPPLPFSCGIAPNGPEAMPSLLSLIEVRGWR